MRNNLPVSSSRKTSRILAVIFCTTVCYDNSCALPHAGGADCNRRLFYAKTIYFILSKKSVFDLNSPLVNI
jgi:hypothetical protein